MSGADGRQRSPFRWRDPLGSLRRSFQFRSVRSATDEEVDEEIAFHLAHTEGQLLREGLSPDDARREAQRRFGDIDTHRQRLQRINRWRGRSEHMRGFIEATGQTLRAAVRTVRGNPWVTITVVATLGLGIGANAVMFGIVDRLLLRAPAHIVHPEEVARVAVRSAFIDRQVVSTSMAHPDVLDLQEAASFAGVAAWGGGDVVIGAGENAMRASGVRAMPELFDLLGVRATVGRFFRVEEDLAGGADVVVLGYDLWRDRFGGDPAVLGTTIELTGVAHEIVGVAPPGFTGVGLSRVDVWTPLRSRAFVRSPLGEIPWENNRGWHWLRAVVRLAPGVSAEAAATEATALHRAARATDDADAEYDPQAEMLMEPLIAARGSQRSNESVVARWLSGVAGMVLLIACANVANILVATSLRRRREIGVRLALGVSQRRLVAQLLCEGVLLALLGGAAALAVARWGADLVRGTLMPDVFWADSPVSGRVMLFTFAMAVGTGLLAGLVPALQARRHDLSTILAGGARGGSRQRSRLRAGMLVLQTSLSVVLLVGAGLFVRSLANINAIDHGFELDGLLMVDPEIDASRVPEEQVGALIDDALQRLRALPQVRAATTTMTAPFWSSIAVDLAVPGLPELPEFSNGGPYVIPVGSDYFETMRVQILAGRAFDDGDIDGAAPVALVEETLAAAYWPGENPIGKCMVINEGPCTEIVGIAEATARDELLPTENAQYYVPLAQHRDWEFGTPSLMLRVDPGQLDEAADAVRKELFAIDGIRFPDVVPLRSLLDPQARSWTLGASMFSLFGLLALVIASVGLYGVLAFDVAQRTHEIGVRSALGATAGSVAGLVLRHALLLVGGSVALGLLVARLLGPWIEPLLYGVGAGDAGVLSLVAAVLLIVAGVAASLPALRAARVDPVIALRQD